ncbi:gliding motility-associated C-terminal domain-containing protein [Flagellimonas profundi]|uniref:Gliding motility-associated C-terminal domain-containing protein n=1 Tax=Flagellimonas profundi TaxID=2915620 RepID=A0ABS3FCG1_9FLAO|nr:gliding motility-associated C-terminal domain-containing protein [Allomuricauda profundi]MBO0340843.1 gliding motility-associated C-terminal domain-containing protein [Allomuricauda profundi]
MILYFYLCKKKKPLLLPCVLFILVFTNASAHISSYDRILDSDENPNFKNVCSNEIFAPEISLIKTGTVSQSCRQITFNFQVVNQSTSGEVLENVVLNDPLLGGDIVGPVSGDVNNNTFLDPGEIWIYSWIYLITNADISNGEVVNQATVTADVQGQPGVTVQDLSDDNSIAEDDSTVIDLSSCQPRIAVVKTGYAIAGFEAGPGCDLILYEFTVTNEGPEILENVVLNDPLLGGDIPGPAAGDDNNDGFLDLNETWVYSASYNTLQGDIDNGFVENQATVTADVQGLPGATVQDLSDDNSILEDDPTVIILSSCEPRIAVVKTGDALEGVDGGPGCNLILYEFTVTNEGPEILENVVLNDPLLGGDIPGPAAGDDNNDGFLDLDETWVYSASYNTLQSDMNNGFVENQATVTADVQGQPGVTVQDLSDDNSILEDDPTIVDLSFCPGEGGIGIIKTGTLINTNGDLCEDSIRYIFSVTNTGDVDLDNVIIEDELVDGTIQGPLNGTDIGNDGVLSVGESWDFEAFYIIQQVDIDQGLVENQAVVTAQLVGSGSQVLDLSDHTNLSDDNPTITLVPDNICEDEPVAFEIFNGITPNGDGINDYFQIEGIENYPDNNVKIFNRWGVQVYQVDGYGQGNKLFYGISEVRATLQKDRELPSGTYFYILTFTGENNPGEENYSGYLYINRN